MGLFNKEQTDSLEPMLTPEQQEAQRILLQLAQGGNIGGVQTGEQYGGSLGNFTQTATEGAAGNRIYDLLNAGQPNAFNKAEQTFNKLADTTFDPEDPSTGFGAYKKQVARATQDADDVINRNAAITGNRFGDRILNTKQDLAMQQSDMLASKLADLYNTAQNRSLAGAQGLTGLGGAQRSSDLSTIGMASEIGGLQRMLDTSQAQSQYQEWQRARGEKLGSSIGAAESLWGKDVPYGIKSYTTSNTTPLGNLLNSGLTAGGSALGNILLPGIGGPIGGMIGSTAGGMITGADNSGAQSGLMDLLAKSMQGGEKSQSQILGFNTGKYR